MMCHNKYRTLRFQGQLEPSFFVLLYYYEVVKVLRILDNKEIIDITLLYKIYYSTQTQKKKQQQVFITCKRVYVQYRHRTSDDSLPNYVFFYKKKVICCQFQSRTK